jgi:long-chain acyl-CoA synthetase
MTDTILHRLHENGRIRPNAPAYYEKIGSAWVPTSWQEYTNQVRQAARALVALGVEPGQNVAILGFNRPEWVIFDLACMMIGGIWRPGLARTWARARPPRGSGVDHHIAV